jgi:hypothetical protein
MCRRSTSNDLLASEWTVESLGFETVPFTYRRDPLTIEGLETINHLLLVYNHNPKRFHFFLKYTHKQIQVIHTTFVEKKLIINTFSSSSSFQLLKMFVSVLEFILKL